MKKFLKKLTGWIAAVIAVSAAGGTVIFMTATFLGNETVAAAGFLMAAFAVCLAGLGKDMFLADLQSNAKGGGEK